MKKWMVMSMYKSFYGMEFNPFDKEQKGSDFYKSYDFMETQKRLEHLKNVKGIGLFMGEPGEGKTSAIRYFVESLNKNLYQVSYIQLTTVGICEFYRDLSISLGLEPRYRKLDNFKQIQEQIQILYKDNRVTPVFWIDEAQYLNHNILSDLKLLMNFEMDSKNYAIMILSGLPRIHSTISLKQHEALHQRVAIHYRFHGLSHEEVTEYIRSRFVMCGVKSELIEASAMKSMSEYANGSVRKLDNVIHKALMIGCSRETTIIDNEIVMESINETELL